MIRNGLSEVNADRAIERLHEEFSAAKINDAAQFQQLADMLAERVAEECRAAVKRPSKIESIKGKLLPWIIGIGTGIIANKLTDLIPNLIGPPPNPPSLFCPIGNPVSVIRLGKAIIIESRTRERVLRAATDGFISTIARPGVNATTIRYSREWATNYDYEGSSFKNDGLKHQKDVIGQLSGWLVVFELSLNGAPADPLPYLPRLMTLEKPMPEPVTAALDPLAVERARLILHMAAQGRLL